MELTYYTEPLFRNAHQKQFLQERANHWGIGDYMGARFVLITGIYHIRKTFSLPNKKFETISRYDRHGGIQTFTPLTSGEQGDKVWNATA